MSTERWVPSINSLNGTPCMCRVPENYTQEPAYISEADHNAALKAALSLLKRFPPDDSPIWELFGGASIWLDTEEYIALTRASTPSKTPPERTTHDHRD